MGGGGRRAKKVSLLKFTAYSSYRLQLLHIIFVQASRHSNYSEKRSTFESSIFTYSINSRSMFMYFYMKPFIILNSTFTSITNIYI